MQQSENSNDGGDEKPLSFPSSIQTIAKLCIMQISGELYVLILSAELYHSILLPYFHSSSVFTNPSQCNFIES